MTSNRNLKNNSSAVRIAELFSSIQGESTYAGRPCFFIRLAGCPYRCSYCDTVFAQDFAYGKEYEISEIVDCAVKSKLPLAEITGGEPLAQANTISLINALLEVGIEVMLETNGGCDISEVSPKVKRILDCKWPSSNMADKNLYENYLLIANLAEDDEGAKVEYRFVFDNFMFWYTKILSLLCFRMMCL